MNLSHRDSTITIKDFYFKYSKCYHYYYYYRAVDDLSLCVTNIIRPVCGKRAAELFVDMCQYQVPKQLTEHCNPPPPFTEPPPNTSAKNSFCYLLYLVTCLTIYLLVSPNRGIYL